MKRIKYFIFTLYIGFLFFIKFLLIYLNIYS